MTQSASERILERFRGMLDAQGSVRDWRGVYSAAGRTGRAVGELVANGIVSGELSAEDAGKLLKDLTGKNHDHVAGMVDDLIREKNRMAGIGLNPARNPRPVSRMSSLAEALEDENNDSVTCDTLPDYTEGLSLHSVDEGIRRNADMHYGAGLNPKIVRTVEGSCCAWCANMAGEYDYSVVSRGEKECFRRHKLCRCIVSYEPGDGSRTNVFEQVQAREEAQRAERDARVASMGG